MNQYKELGLKKRLGEFCKFLEETEGCSPLDRMEKLAIECFIEYLETDTKESE